MGTGAGNLLQTILRDTCEKLLQERVLRIEQYRAVRDTAEVLLGAALNQLDKSVVNSVIQADRRVGSSHYKAKLKDHDILEIRNLAAQGEKRSDIAKKYGVSDKTIWGIQTGKTWKHVGGPKTLSKYRKQNLTDEDRAKIVRLRKAGKSLQEIALEMRRGKSTIMRVCTQAGVSNPRTRSEMCRKGGLARWGIRMT
jgi:DNA invertase Pin-like site-specific DNA recombinase